MVLNLFVLGLAIAALTVLAVLVARSVERGVGNQTVSPMGLAVFRVWFGISVLAEIGTLFYYRHLIYDRVPYLSRGEFNVAPVLALWAVAAVFVTLGFRFRLAAVVNYILAVVVLGSLHDFEYHYDFIIISTSLLLIWAPAAETLSVDRILYRSEAPSRVLRLWPLLILFASLASMYFVSAVHKVESPFWRNGLGLWMPATLPIGRWLAPEALLDQPSIMRIMSYVVLVFEYSFALVMWNRRAWLPLFMVGVGFHVGIAIFFPIPIFALGVAGFFLLLVPDWVWRPVSGRFEPWADAMFVRVSSWIEAWELRPWVGRDEHGLLPRVRPSARALAIVVGLVTIANVVVITQIPLVKNRLASSFPALSWATQRLDRPVKPLRRFTGIGFHDIFTDKMFKGYNHAVRLAYEDDDGTVRPLPMMTETGSPKLWLVGRVFRGWMFSAVGPTIDPDRLEDGVSRFSAYWAKNAGVDLEGATFHVQVKEIEVPRRWEEGFLYKQQSGPWIDEGTVVWNDGELTGELPIIGP